MHRKELPYFHIDGHFGGSQSWFLDPWMHIGGCGAMTMCDLLLYQAICRGRDDCDPFREKKFQDAEGHLDEKKLSRRDYRKFGMIMKPYLRPRESGIKDLQTFIDGALLFLEDSEIEGFSMQKLDGHRLYADAEAAVMDRIDHGMPVPMLMLKHRDKRFNFFEWHWFLLVGYEKRQSGLYVKAATYGKEHWLEFEPFWNTGEIERGGLVLVSEETDAEKGTEGPGEDQQVTEGDR